MPMMTQLRLPRCNIACAELTYGDAEDGIKRRDKNSSSMDMIVE
jgi:hypothetical protein